MTDLWIADEFVGETKPILDGQIQLQLSRVKACPLHGKPKQSRTSK